MKRLFLAIPVETSNNGFVPLLNELQKKLAHEKFINWSKYNNKHLTLKFIGDTYPDDIQKIINAVEKIVEHHERFTIDFDRTGIFGSRYAPRVVWLGMQNTPQRLMDLEEELLKSFDDIGFLRDRQNFIPHITLGRVKELCDKKYFQKVIDNIEQKTYIRQEVKDIILFQSILRPEGALYKEIKIWHLK